MPRYRNADVHRRVFGHLQNADGSTVALDPDEEVDLDEDIDDVHLVRVEVTPAKDKKWRVEATEVVTADDEGKEE